MNGADSLPAILAGAGLRLKRLTPGHNEHIRCPRCEGGTSRELSCSVDIDPDGAGAVWVCHRGTCGWSGSGRVRHGWKPQTPLRREPLPKHSEEQQQHRPEWLHKFFDERRIATKTLNHFGIYAVERFFPGLGKRPAVVFPYRWNGKVVTRKYRPYPEKGPQSQENTGEPVLFNAEVLEQPPETLLWVEGEPDVLAMFESGQTNVVSLRDGAPAQAKFRQDDARFAALTTHAVQLAKVKHHVLAGDMDGPGMALKEELARRLGRHKVSLVTWPRGCKDAGEVLATAKDNGPAEIEAALAAATPYPIEGILDLGPDTLRDWRKSPPPPTMTTGTGATDKVLKLPVEGRLIVVTGTPNHGKSTWVRFTALHTMGKHGRKWLVFSPEHEFEQFMVECAEAFIGEPFWPGPGSNSGQGMADAQVDAASEFLRDHVKVLQCDATDQAPTLEWLLERAAYCVLRDGTTDFLIDPWNEIEHQRGDMTETDYTGRTLQRLRGFALRHGCNVWVVAHPAKPPPLKNGEKRNPPGAYDISGSAHWANKTDLGVTVWAPEMGEAEIIVWKTRFRRWGRRGDSAKLDFDASVGRYRTPVADLHGSGPDDAPPHWSDQDDH
jgi:twinkle protein